MEKAQPDELHNKIIEWVEKSGGSLELKTALAYKNAKYSISQGYYYQDTTTDKFRETDLLAFSQSIKTANDLPTFTVAVTFLIECKRSSKNPWVVFVSNDSERHEISDASVYDMIMCDLTKNTIVDAIAQSFEQDQYIYPTGQTAFAVHQAKLNQTDTHEGGDMAHAAVQQVLSAVESRAATAIKANERDRCHITIPIIVVEGRLFQSSYGTDGPIVKEIQEITLVLRNRSVAGGSAMIKIVHASIIDEFAERCRYFSAWVGSFAPLGQLILHEQKSSEV